MYPFQHFTLFSHLCKSSGEPVTASHANSVKIADTHGGCSSSIKMQTHSDVPERWHRLKSQCIEDGYLRCRSALKRCLGAGEVGDQGSSLRSAQRIALGNAVSIWLPTSLASLQIALCPAASTHPDITVSGGTIVANHCSMRAMLYARCGELFGNEHSSDTIRVEAR